MSRTLASRCSMLLRMADEAVDNLRAFRLRSWLSLIGIAVGAASVIAIVNIGENAAGEAARQFQEMGTDTLVVQKGFSGRPQSSELRLSDMGALVSEVTGIALLAPMTTAMAQTRFNGQALDINVAGVTPELLELARLHVKQGRFLSTFDDAETFAVVGYALAESLRTAGVAVRLGDSLRVDNYEFTVVGILDRGFHNPIVPVDLQSSLLVPIRSIRRVLAAPAQISSVLVRVANGADPLDVAARIEEYLKQKGIEPVEVRSARQLIVEMRRQRELFTYLLAGIGAVSLLVGGIGVMNVMLAGIVERRQEMGVRRAIGARERDILSMVLFEAAALSVSGGLVGTVFGVAIAGVFAALSGWTFSLYIPSLAVGLGMSIAVGVFFGIYPATRAARLSPLEALRAD